MKFLNFIPLLLFALGFVFITCLDEHWREQDGRGPWTEKIKDGAASFYGVGLIFFCIVGVVLSV